MPDSPASHPCPCADGILSCPTEGVSDKGRRSAQCRAVCHRSVSGLFVPGPYCAVQCVLQKAVREVTGTQAFAAALEAAGLDRRGVQVEVCRLLRTTFEVWALDEIGTAPPRSLLGIAEWAQARAWAHVLSCVEGYKDGGCPPATAHRYRTATLALDASSPSDRLAIAALSNAHSVPPGSQLDAPTLSQRSDALRDYVGTLIDADLMRDALVAAGLDGDAPQHGAFFASAYAHLQGDPTVEGLLAATKDRADDRETVARAAMERVDAVGRHDFPVVGVHVVREVARARMRKRCELYLPDFVRAVAQYGGVPVAKRVQDIETVCDYLVGAERDYARELLGHWAEVNDEYVRYLAAVVDPPTEGA